MPALFRLAAITALVFTLAACSSSRVPLPPTGTPTPSPDSKSAPSAEWDGDPRCEAGYGDPHRTLEKEHAVRPDGWPQTPPFAVLCILEPISSVEEVGYYATDPGTKFDDVLWYYEHAFLGGVHGYLPTPGSEKIYTGVIGGVSYFLEQHGFDRYTITWAIDGEYVDGKVTASD